MLQAINLCKTYNPKKGIPVKALDNINLTFPDTGMVFLLGKSGSGKSTLLNILGGLDKYDSGDIIIKNTSTKKFNQSHFDSYRNTYIGFIFQEYNILEEFTVGANVALAIELQGRKAENEEINRILTEVDLDGYGDRRPNELSGGQKQRVAIARALVKNPEIIFADEPTGALDSATGKQVFDTLKKLSKDKLVVIVSHDREFAEGYADRIIELSDGRVIDDVTLTGNDVSAEALTFSESSVTVSAGYQLTEEDREMINRFLRSSDKNLEIKKIAISGRGFVKTNQDDIKPEKDGIFKLIKSRLPIKNAFKIGRGALKYKKIRLVFTVLLSLVAFTLFGLASTFASYDHIYSCTDSIIDSDIRYATIGKASKNYYGKDRQYTWNDASLSEKDIKELSEKTGIALEGVIKRRVPFVENLYTGNPVYATFSESGNRAVNFNGFAPVSSEVLEKMGYDIIAGRLPDGSKSEIAITKFVYDSFSTLGYQDNNSKVTVITKPEDMIGKTISNQFGTFTVTGVIDTHFDSSRYNLMSMTRDKMTEADMIVVYALRTEFEYETSYGLCTTAFVGKGFNFNNEDKLYVSLSGNSDDNGIYYYMSSGCHAVSTLRQIDKDKVHWINGEKATLARDEVIINTACTTIFEVNEASGIHNSVELTDSTKGVLDKMSHYSLYVLREDEYTSNSKEYNDLKIVGFFSNEFGDETIVVSDGIYNEVNGEEGETRYSFAVGAMPTSAGDVKNLVKFCYDESGDYSYPLKNAVTFELDGLRSSIYSISSVFVYVGLFFAAFATILFSTFIASSVAYKKQEIGILRAIGSRSKDVFMIFFSEAFIIAMINFVLTNISTALVVFAINGEVRDGGLLITFLHFGIKQVSLIFIICAAVAAIASFLPVWKIASKRPIDAIRNR